MKHAKPLAIATLTALLAALPALAHHSFAAEFDGTKPVRLTGVLTKIEWTNPHSYFYLDVLNAANGSTSHWICEGGGPGALSRRGWKRSDIKLGDQLVVDGYLAKDGSNFIDAQRVKLPDGRSVEGGSPGDGGPGDRAPAGARGASAAGAAR
jgi:hypothetical protein